MRPFGKHPGGVLAGVMFITALFSMFMSNTATTAMMIVLVQPLALQVPAGDRFRRGLVLAVPFAANVGGIGTPIGTPPNAIALEALRARGLEINFFEWMAFALPLLVGTLAVMWLLLFILYRRAAGLRSGQERIQTHPEGSRRLYDVCRHARPLARFPGSTSSSG